MAGIFIALMDPALTAITQAAYLGGTGFEFGFLSSGNVELLYVSGATTSTDFPGTAGGAQTSFAGGGMATQVGSTSVAVQTP